MRAPIKMNINELNKMQRVPSIPDITQPIFVIKDNIRHKKHALPEFAYNNVNNKEPTDNTI